jgi:hypothetical protein
VPPPPIVPPFSSTKFVHERKLWTCVCPVSSASGRGGGIRRSSSAASSVGRQRVPGFLAHSLHVRQLPRGELLGRLAVDGAHVHGQARGETHRTEAGAPVHERHVQVECAAVERLHRQLDPAHAELALLAVGRERQQPPAENGDHDEGHRRRTADGPHRPQASGAPRAGYSWYWEWPPAPPAFKSACPRWGSRLPKALSWAG